MGSSPSKNLGAEFPSATAVKVQDCPEEFDQTKREAMFAFRTTDLGSNDQSSAVIKELKHWSLVVHFPRGDKTYLFEADKDEVTGRLEASRTDNVDIKVFEKAMYMYFGDFQTSPRQLLELAKKVSSNGTPYDLTTNNCQTWLKEFLQLISPKLFKSFKEMLHEYKVKTTTITAGGTVGAIVMGLAVGVLYEILKKK